MSRIWWLSLCFFLIHLLASSSPVFAQKISRNVPYGAQSTSGPLTLDVYEPTSPPSGMRPLVIFVHGGGFRAGDKSQGTPYATEFTSAGFVFASIDYRLTGEAIFPAAPTDVSKPIIEFI
ncbi:MAG: carboxylesterase family protein [Acidobacteria bacterium]|nr:carboxylesterase family protein [Acidobacteriota bacterium]